MAVDIFADTASAYFDDYFSEILLHLFLLSFGIYLFQEQPRNPSVFEQRLTWIDYSAKHTKKGTFQSRLRMKRNSFDKLLAMIREELEVNEAMAERRGGAIIPELCLYCTLRWLAGGSYLDICNITGISTASFYRVVWKTVIAINKCQQMDMHFPQTKEQCLVAAAGFESISAKSLVNGEAAIKHCVGVVDGYLLRITTPSRKDVGNVRSYFSGHYQCYGVNLQAVSDHQSRFIYMAVAAPGVTPDRDAIKRPHSSLDERVEALPLGFCLIGDAAYEATERMVPIYQGIQKLKPKYDNFNFYASQCRIRVEMSFGLMQQKWGILQRPVAANDKCKRLLGLPGQR